MSSQSIPPDDKSNDAGYKRPPAASRFKKGRSGNCAGRPRGRASEAPYEAVLGQMVDIREDGLSRRVTATEALLLVMMKKSLEKAEPSLANSWQQSRRISIAQGPPKISGLLSVFL